MKPLLSILLVFSLNFSLNAKVYDLNELKQDFVLETKKIEIPGYPEAFNASIVSWNNQLLMAFRTYDPITRSTDSIRLVWLDKNFQPTGPSTLLRREGEVTSDPSWAQDPRLVVVDQDLFIVYSNLYPYKEPTRRMVVCKLQMESDGSFLASYPASILYYEGEIRERKEKNWVPFVYENTLMLAYSLQPHSIFLPVLDMNRCASLSSTMGTIQWDFGCLRGGSPALKVDDCYLGFFHSDKALASIQSNGVVMNHYFMGAYTFQAEYPFAITGISPQPIVAKTFYEGPMYQTWKPLRVVFPCGFIVDGNTIWVSYGRQDHEIWVVKLDKTKLLSSLKAVSTVEGPAS